MLLALPGNPTAFTLIPALQYGEVPEVPPWVVNALKSGSVSLLVMDGLIGNKHVE